MNPKKYKKKPVVIEAMQYSVKNRSSIINWIVNNGGNASWHCNNGIECAEGDAGHTIRIKTLEGDMDASFGDYVIRGVNGEFYPCKPDIFAKTYDLVNKSTDSGYVEPAYMVN